MAADGYVLSPRSADLFRAWLADGGRVGGGASRTPPPGNPSGLVRCTSATAAGTTGLAAVCYPGVYVPPDCSAATPADGGTVWLTVLGPGGTPGVPVSGQTYPCELGAYIDPAQANDWRPRAVGPAMSGGGGYYRYTCAAGVLTETLYSGSPS